METEYDVRVTVVMEMTVPVFAKGMEDAKDIAKQKWKNGEYPHDAAHLKSLTFETLYPDYSRPMEKTGNSPMDVYAGLVASWNKDFS